MSVSVAAEWDELANRFYSKREVYTMCWEGVDLGLHMVAAASFGGPIALIRDERKLLALGKASPVPRVRIYTAAGVLVSSFRWDRPGGRLVQMGWTEEETLLCVMEDGKVYEYNLQGTMLARQLDFGRECWDQGVARALIWPSGVLCLTHAHQLFAIPSLADPRSVKLPVTGLQEPPHSMAIVEAHHSRSGLLEVLLSVGATVLVATEEKVEDQAVSIGPLRQMAISPSGAFLACFTSDGRLLVLLADFSKSLSEFDTESADVPDQLVWCGVDSVLLYWEARGLVLMVGPYGDLVRYEFERPPLLLIPEMDGVRILSGGAMDFLHRVPDSAVAVFEIGSTAPGALLFDALESFDKRSAKADESLQAIGPQLGEAVETCIDAAGHEFDVDRQKLLMRAAIYGRAFCRSFPRDRIRDTCKTLQVLNAVRSFETAGLPLSFRQYEALTPRVLVARLVNAHRHLLALRISRLLDLPEEIVLVHWASVKISASPNSSDVALLDHLFAKLKSSAKVSYAAVAANAYKQGRVKLAAMLLDHEPRAEEQVPLLTSMEEGERALSKAIESSDTHLIYFVIFHLWQKRSMAEMIRILKEKPVARDLFVSYAKLNDQELLKKYCSAAGQPQGVAEIAFRESFRPADVKGRAKLLEAAGELYSQTREHAFHAKACEEQAKLLRLQADLEAKMGISGLVDLPLGDTIRRCISAGNHAAVQRIRADFKVPDRRFYFLKILTLAHAKDWDALEHFCRERRPPVGYMPFVDACIENGSDVEAAKYIPKVTDLQDRAEAYARIGRITEAAEAAALAKDGELLNRLRSTFASQNAAAGALFDSFRDRLNLQR